MGTWRVGEAEKPLVIGGEECGDAIPRGINCKENPLKTVPLSIPFLVISTRQDGYETLEKHVLTPFGSLDISLPLGMEGENLCEVRVSGQVDHWLVDDCSMPEEFQAAVSRFILKLIEEMMGGKVPDHCRLSIGLDAGDGPRILTCSCTSVNG